MCGCIGCVEGLCGICGMWVFGCGTHCPFLQLTQATLQSVCVSVGHLWGVRGGRVWGPPTLLPWYSSRWGGAWGAGGWPWPMLPIAARSAAPTGQSLSLALPTLVRHEREAPGTEPAAFPAPVPGASLLCCMSAPPVIQMSWVGTATRIAMCSAVWTHAPVLLPAAVPTACQGREP